MDLCLSCKGCKRECPSNVDVAKLKAEFLQGYYDSNGVPRRAKLIANFARTNAWASHVPWLYNFAVSVEPFASLLKRFAGFAPERSLPRLHPTTLRRWFDKHKPRTTAGSTGNFLLFCDEFTDYNDTPIGIAAVELMERLGYRIEIPDHRESGRAALSKGLLRQAREVAEENVRLLSGRVTTDRPLVGIEPSAILSFRDEYPELVRPELRADAKQLAENSLLIDEYIAQQMEVGRIKTTSFTDAKREIRLHGHCHQKAIASLKPAVQILELPENYVVKPIADGDYHKTGCCGMAGSFGYEREHYQLSKQVGELVLIPAVKRTPNEVLIAATGTSCRHQIADLAGRIAQHPVEILRAALK